MRVCEVDLYPVNCLRLVLLLRLENELLQDVVVARHDTNKSNKLTI